MTPPSPTSSLLNVQTGRWSQRCTLWSRQTSEIRHEWRRRWFKQWLLRWHGTCTVLRKRNFRWWGQLQPPLSRWQQFQWLVRILVLMQWENGNTAWNVPCHQCIFFKLSLCTYALVHDSYQPTHLPHLVIDTSTTRWMVNTLDATFISKVVQIKVISNVVNKVVIAQEWQFQVRRVQERGNRDLTCAYLEWEEQQTTLSVCYGFQGLKLNIIWNTLSSLHRCGCLFY